MRRVNPVPKPATAGLQTNSSVADEGRDLEDRQKERDHDAADDDPQHRDDQRLDETRERCAVLL